MSYLNYLSALLRCTGHATWGFLFQGGIGTQIRNLLLALLGVLGIALFRGRLQRLGLTDGTALRDALVGLGLLGVMLALAAAAFAVAYLLFVAPYVLWRSSESRHPPGSLLAHDATAELRQVRERIMRARRVRKDEAHETLADPIRRGRLKLIGARSISGVVEHWKWEPVPRALLSQGCFLWETAYEQLVLARRGGPRGQGPIEIVYGDLRVLIRDANALFFDIHEWE